MNQLTEESAGMESKADAMDLDINARAADIFVSKVIQL